MTQASYAQRAPTSAAGERKVSATHEHDGRIGGARTTRRTSINVAQRAQPSAWDRRDRYDRRVGASDERKPTRENECDWHVERAQNQPAPSLSREASTANGCATRMTTAMQETIEGRQHLREKRAPPVSKRVKRALLVKRCMCVELVKRCRRCERTERCAVGPPHVAKQERHGRNRRAP
jgi:hypothetical protein